MGVFGKVVLDTNVVVSGLLNQGKCRQILELAARRRMLVVSSPSLEQELVRVLRDKFGYNQIELMQAIVTYKELVYQTVFPVKQVKIARDESDNRILEVAIEAQVDAVVTGDKDLLVLKEYQGVAMVLPSDYLRFKE